MPLKIMYVALQENFDLPQLEQWLKDQGFDEWGPDEWFDQWYSNHQIQISFSFSSELPPTTRIHVQTFPERDFPGVDRHEVLSILTEIAQSLLNFSQA